MTAIEPLAMPYAIALIAAIDAGDDLALLSLADLLEEAGDPRADGLRVAARFCREKGLPAPPPVVREQPLADAVNGGWTGYSITRAVGTQGATVAAASGALLHCYATSAYSVGVCRLYFLDDAGRRWSSAHPGVCRLDHGPDHLIIHSGDYRLLSRHVARHEGEANLYDLRPCLDDLRGRARPTSRSATYLALAEALTHA